MNPARMTAAVLMIGTLGANAQTAPGPGLPAVVETTVTACGEEREIAALAAGREDGVSLGAKFWVFGEAAVAGSGTVYFVTDKQSVGRLAGPGQGDPVLVRRGEIPIARGCVEILENETALVRLWPLVGNALPERGDSAELWPGPAERREARLNSSVLAVTPDDEGPIVTIAGTAADGLAEGRLVDLYRKGKYVGVASIIRTSDPLSEARLIEPASPAQPEVGDLALVRAPAAEPPRPLSAVIFRVESDYCLLAAGESDGVREGEQFVVRRPDPAHADLRREIAELTVRTVKEDYCGAYVRPLVADGARITPWEMAERRVPPPPTWRSIGMVETVDAASRSATAGVDPESGMVPGAAVCWIPRDGKSPGGAIVLRVLAAKAILYVPPGWGDLSTMQGAGLEVLRDASGAPPNVTTRRAPDTIPSR